MDDGIELAATLYLPDPAAGPQPCLLEALPYRKDDMTSSYAGGYVELRDEHGYAVCRVDVRGTGSSGGDAVDEYPAREQADLAAVIAWLAEQQWCDGNVGMWGTSYSGFNSLQVAAERPPALKAICAIFATDDRWTDDVHWRGGARKLLDLVDYCHYMTPMNALPPVPALWGPGWREEWQRRVATNEPWLLTWLAENADGPYWRHGSLRPDYDRIVCPVMLVAGWADGYRNNSFRTVAALREAGVPHRLVAGPWAHADPATAAPGPRIDLVQEMVAWWDRWLRGRDNGVDERPEQHLRTHVDPTRARSRAARRVLGARGVAEPAGVADDPAAGGAGPVRGESRRRRGRLDRLRRPPAVGAVRRPAPRRRRVDDVGVGRRRDGAARVPGGPAADEHRHAACVCVAQALRRLRRRHLGPGDARLARARTAGAGREARRHRGARRLRLPVRPGAPAAAVLRRQRLAEHRRATRAGDPDRARWRARAAGVDRPVASRRTRVPCRGHRCRTRAPTGCCGGSSATC